MRKIMIAVAASMGLGTGALAQTLVSPGFEQGPDVAEISFQPNDGNGLGWFASNTDGERIRATQQKPAFEGRFYASLLQNAGAYDGRPLGIGDLGFGGFDRIYAFFDVMPNRQYELSFAHAADNRFNYLGNTSVVEVVDAGSNTTLEQRMFATPGLFQWTTERFSFTTGPNTTRAAVAFTVMGGGNTSGVFDAISVIPAPGSAALAGLGLLAAARRRR